MNSNAKGPLSEGIPASVIYDDELQQRLWRIIRLDIWLVMIDTECFMRP